MTRKNVTSKGTPKIAKTYPADRFPYMVVKPNADQPQYFRSHREAIERLERELHEERDRTKYVDSEGAAYITECMKAVRELPLEGGRVDLLMIPMFSLRYKVELVKRSLL